MFPEGTNLTANTIEKSNKFALANSMKPMTHVLYPRTTGFVHIFNQMSKLDLIDCVQDVTVAYRGGKMPENESDFLFGNLPDEIHFYVEKFNSNLKIEQKAKEINVDENTTKRKLENWLIERWNKKEVFLKE